MMLNLFVDTIKIEMYEHQEQAVKDMLKVIDPETEVIVCGEYNEQTGLYPVIEKLRIEDLFDL